MKVVSVNIGERKEINWRGKIVETGIFKYPVDNEIILESTDVVGDKVIDRKYHGGLDKACYIYSADHYPFWKELHPNLAWDYGMFGENITIEGLNESDIRLGDRYEIGSAIVEVSQPREPCFKLGVRFGTQTVLKQFFKAPFPGVYLRVIVPGKVKKGDTLTLIEKGPDFAILAEVYRLAFHSVQNDKEHINKILNLKKLPVGLKSTLEKRLRLIVN